MLPERLLIANRGEIAVRIANTCRQMGITSVGVYANSDANAMFVRHVDVAMPIGGVTAPESYLRGELLIRAALEAGASALHPGYGFLSERPEFAEACADAGLLFIGPTAAAMKLLGNKIAAQRLAAECGIPTISGYRGPDQSASRLAAEAEKIGFPLLVKAAAGGGGRGMRVVRDYVSLRPGLEAAQREATAAFGDGTVFLERYLAAPRHIEVQLIADDHGRVLILGDRDCSVQRRHQKVIEEAPAPNLDGRRRAAIHAAARRIAEAAAYTNAGTVEFLLDDSSYYFLEMNTRLQVEHPVSEQVTGIDIVEQQIRVATGQPLSPARTSIAPRGHAIEARLNAEAPAHGFLPAAGRVERCDFPHMPGLRIDTGIEAGDEVNPHFDSMIAKLIAEGPTREIAIRRLDAALARTEIQGVTTNRAFLLGILRQPVFLAARHTTAFLAEHEPVILPLPLPPKRGCWLAAAIGASLMTKSGPSYAEPFAVWSSEFGAWRHGVSRRAIALSWNGIRDTVVIWRDSDGVWHDDSGTWTASVKPADGWRCDLMHDGARHRLRVKRRGLEVTVVDAVDSYQFFIVSAPVTTSQASDAPSGAGLTAPMPGVIVKHFIEVGSTVKFNQPLLAIEAMKMEHIVVAPYGGTITRLPFAVGALAPAGSVLAVVEPHEVDRAAQ